MEVLDFDLAGTDHLDETLDEAAVEAADEVGVGLGQLSERAVREGDRGRLVVAGDRRVEPESVELGDRARRDMGAA